VLERSGAMARCIQHEIDHSTASCISTGLSEEYVRNDEKKSRLRGGPAQDDPRYERVVYQVRKSRPDMNAASAVIKEGAVSGEFVQEVSGSLSIPPMRRNSESKITGP
jgi:hypothetical protein